MLEKHHINPRYTMIQIILDALNGDIQDLNSIHSFSPVKTRTSTLKSKPEYKKITDMIEDWYFLNFTQYKKS